MTLMWRHCNDHMSLSFKWWEFGIINGNPRLISTRIQVCTDKVSPIRRLRTSCQLTWCSGQCMAVQTKYDMMNMVYMTTKDSQAPLSCLSRHNHDNVSTSVWPLDDQILHRDAILPGDSRCEICPAFTLLSINPCCTKSVTRAFLFTPHWEPLC